MHGVAPRARFARALRSLRGRVHLNTSLRTFLGFPGIPQVSLGFLGFATGFSGIELDALPQNHHKIIPNPPQNLHKMLASESRGIVKLFKFQSKSSQNHSKPFQNLPKSIQNRPQTLPWRAPGRVWRNVHEIHSFLSLFGFPPASKSVQNPPKIVPKSI